MFGREEEGGAVVGAEEADAFFGYLGELEEGYHLEAGGRKASSQRLFGRVRGGEEDVRATHPPLSTLVSTLQCGEVGAKSTRTCEDIMGPRLKLVRAAYRIECCLSWLEASPDNQQRP